MSIFCSASYFVIKPFWDFRFLTFHWDKLLCLESRLSTVRCSIVLSQGWADPNTLLVNQGIVTCPNPMIMIIHCAQDLFYDIKWSCKTYFDIMMQDAEETNWIIIMLSINWQCTMQNLYWTNDCKILQNIVVKRIKIKWPLAWNVILGPFEYLCSRVLCWRKHYKDEEKSK